MIKKGMLNSNEIMPWTMVVAGSFIVLLRLVIWKFFPDADLIVKEHLSNLIVALFQFLFAGVLAAFVLRQRMTYRWTRLEGPLGLMVVAATGSLLFTGDFSVTLRAVLPLLASIAFFLALVQVLDNDQRIRIFLFLMLGLAVMTAAFGIREFFYLSSRSTVNDASIALSDRSLYYVLTHRRVTSFLGWPNSLAGYLHLTLPLALLGVFLVRGVWLRWLLAVASIILLGGFLCTFSFLGWLSFIIAGLLLAPFLFKRLWPHASAITRRVVLGGGILLLVLFLIVIVRKDFAGAIAPRLVYYKSALGLLQEKPVLGQGWGMFLFAARPQLKSIEDMTAFVHNSYLQWWVEGGLAGFVGILFFIWVIAGMIRAILRYYDEGEEAWIALAVSWAVVAFLVDNLFSFTFLKPNIAVHGWAVLAALPALYVRTLPVVKPSCTSRPVMAPWLTLGGLAIAMVISGMIAVGLVFQHLGNRAFLRHDIDAAGKSFVIASLWDRWSALYPEAAGDAAVQLFRASRREYHLRLAEVNYLEAIRREPLFYPGYFMLSQVYIATGEKEKALEYARDAKRLSPAEYDRDIFFMQQAEQRQKMNQSAPR